MSLPGGSGNLTQTKGTPLGIDNQFLLRIEGANPPVNYGVSDLVFKPGGARYEPAPDKSIDKLRGLPPKHVIKITNEAEAN